MAQFLVVLVIAVNVIMVVAGSDSLNTTIILEDGVKAVTISFEKPKSYDQYKEDIKRSLEKEDQDFLLPYSWSDEENNDDSGTPEDESMNCRSITEVKTPYMLMDNASKVLIAQTDVFTQKFRMTRCAYEGEQGITTQNDNSQCFPYMSFGLRGTCQTKSTVIDLITYNMERNEIEKIKAEFPICCYCSVSID